MTKVALVQKIIFITSCSEGSRPLQCIHRTSGRCFATQSVMAHLMNATTVWVTTLPYVIYLGCVSISVCVADDVMVLNSWTRWVSTHERSSAAVTLWAALPQTATGVCLLQRHPWVVGSWPIQDGVHDTSGGLPLQNKSFPEAVGKTTKKY